MLQKQTKQKEQQQKKPNRVSNNDTFFSKIA